MTRFTRLAILLTVVGCAPTAGSEPLAPIVDHHKHVISPTAAAVVPDEGRHEPRAAETLVAELDSVGIQRAVVLSVAYWFGSPLGPPVDDEYMKVRAENDWVALSGAEVIIEMKSNVFGVETAFAWANSRLMALHSEAVKGSRS